MKLVNESHIIARFKEYWEHLERSDKFYLKDRIKYFPWNDCFTVRFSYPTEINAMRVALLPVKIIGVTADGDIAIDVSFQDLIPEIVEIINETI